MNSSQRFIITSHGWSASNWLAHALNLHDDITCTHSAINILPDADYIHEKSGLKKNIRQFHNGYVSRVNQSIDSNYAIIQSYGQSRAYGSVHLYRLRDIPAKAPESAQLESEYTVVNVIRHPISLVWSGYGQFQQLFRFDLNELHWTLGKLLATDKDFVFDLGERHDLYIGDFPVLAFLCACRVLDSLRLDQEAEDWLLTNKHSPSIRYCGHMTMEELTTQPESFVQLFQKLELRDIEASTAYVQKVFSAGKLNEHNHSTRSNDKPIALFESWLPWQQECFLYFLDKYELAAPYSEKGYRFPARA